MEPPLEDSNPRHAERAGAGQRMRGGRQLPAQPSLGRAARRGAAGPPWRPRPGPGPSPSPGPGPGGEEAPPPPRARSAARRPRHGQGLRGCLGLARSFHLFFFKSLFLQVSMKVTSGFPFLRAAVPAQRQGLPASHRGASVKTITSHS